ncbi:unnamed protein product [Effrenium voratum]|nr:unnamed protein product [Effrenium voratum]
MLLEGERAYPSFLSCEGPGFAPIWRDFRELRAEALSQGLSEDGLIELQAHASYIIDQWGGQSVDFVTGWHKEFFQLQASGVAVFPECDGCALPLHSVWLLPSSESHGGFCLHGYVAALSCLLHHLQGRITGASEKTLVQRMQHSLGPQRSLELLLETSPWNLSSQQLGLEPPSEVVPHLDLGPWAWHPLPEASQAAAEAAEAGSVVLAVVGHHSGMSLEPAAAMGAVLAELAEEERLQILFFGQYYACELLQRCDQDALQEPLRRWMFQEELREAFGRSSPTPSVWPELREAVQKEQPLMQASAWICTGIWPLCWMLQQLAQQPVLHYMVNWLVGEHTPQEWHVPLMAEAARIGAESIRGSKHHFCTSAWARLSMDISYLVGLKVPSVPTLGLHTTLHSGPGLRWRLARVSQAAYTAFVPRNVLTRRVQGQLFAAMLQNFNALPWVQNAAPRVRVEVWQGGLQSINRNAGDPWQGQAKGRIWWAEAVEHLAAVYLAGDITLLTFTELYALQVPTLVPQVDWQARIMSEMCKTGIGWFFKHSPLYNLAEGEESFAFSPWGCENLDGLRYWLQAADAWRYAHVSHFSSFMELYVILLRWAKDPSEPQRLSRGMAEFHLQLVIRSLEYFRRLAGAKLHLQLRAQAPSRGLVSALRVSATHTLRRSLQLRVPSKGPGPTLTELAQKSPRREFG